ncbi:MAG TPA: orotate phosphoribosyltransferase [Candidatus Latescibacteria bacterium]|nr:orotate phosphoribosyltransferase [Candidatus Latescibacterota bacterium]
MLNEEEIMEIFRRTGALLSGHFQLTSGLHSSTYFQCAKVLQYPKYARKLCGELAEKFRDRDMDVVIAPAIGGIVVACEVGGLLGLRTIFAEREGGKMTLRRGFEIKRGEKVLVVEDVITTGGSVQEVIELVESKGGVVIGVGCLVDRSGGRVHFGVPYVSLLRMDVVNWEPDRCQLCAEGAKLTKPGSRR